MAWVDKGFKLVVTFQDAQADQTTRTLDLVADNYADAAAAALVCIGYLEAVTAADIVKYEVKQKWNADDASTPANTDVSQGALITMAIDGKPGKSASWVIPAPANAIFTTASGPGNNAVNGSNAAVIALVGMFDASGGECFISEGEHTATGGFLVGHRVPKKGARRFT
jgi:hypothetical protein